jgi:hypothetical protein
MILATAAVLVWRSYASAWSGEGLSRIMWAVSLVLLLPYFPMRALSAWRCRRAARALPEGWLTGAVPLAGWPGVREKQGLLTLRCGSSAFRPWALAVGVAVSGYLLRRLHKGEEASLAFDLVLSLAPALCALLLSAMWGKSGWTLSVESARSQAMLVLWRALRRNLYSTASLPTVQAVELPERQDGTYRGIMIRRAKGTDWKLGIPGTWPPELIEALAARIANLAGVKFTMPEEAGGIPAPRPLRDLPPEGKSESETETGPEPATEPGPEPEAGTPPSPEGATAGEAPGEEAPGDQPSKEGSAEGKGPATETPEDETEAPADKEAAK